MPDKPVRVTVFKRLTRANYEAQWKDPVSGTTKQKSTGHRVRRDAERFAAKLEKESNEGVSGNTPASRRTFRERVERDFLPDVRDSTAAKYRTVPEKREAHLRPKLLREITPAKIGELTATMRSGGNSETTVAGYLRHVKALLNWAHRQELLPKKVRVDVPAGEAAAKGRPLTPAEFARLLRATRAVCGVERGREWRRRLRGLWLSGLRLSEAIALTWDDPDGIRVRLDGKFPAVFIPGRLQKGRKDTVTPLTSDCAVHLSRVPEHERTGFVFSPYASRGGRADHLRAGIIIGRTGAAAEVTVKGVRTATAHDLRRSFCFRWARRILPQHPRSLARHTSVATTL